MSSDNEYVSNFFRSGQTSHLSAAVIVDVSKIELYETIVARQIERSVAPRNQISMGQRLHPAPTFSHVNFHC